MQKIILSFILVLFAGLSYGQRAETMLKIRDGEGRPITCEIDGRKYQKTGRILTVGDLPPGSHRLKVYVVSKKYSGRGSNARLIYTGRIRTKPQKIYFITIDDYERADIIEDCCIGNDENWDSERWYRNRSHDRQKWEKQDGRDWQGGNNQDGFKGQNESRNWNRYGNAMSASQLNQLIEQMRDAGFESSRMNIAKQALAQNQIYTDQLVRILKEFSFESSKLELAKHAYPDLLDKENSFQINKVFSFSSSKDDFSRFVQEDR